MFGKLTVSTNRHCCMQCIGHIFKYSSLYYARLRQSQIPHHPWPQSLFFICVPGWGRVKCLITPDHSCLCQAKEDSSTWSPLTTHVCAKLRQSQVPDHPWLLMSVPGWGRVKYLITPAHSCLCQAEAESSTWSPLTTCVCAKLRQSQVPDRPCPLMSLPSWGTVKYLIAPDHSPCSSYLCQAEAVKYLIAPDHSRCSSCLCQAEAESSTWSPMTIRVCAKLRHSQVPTHSRSVKVLHLCAGPIHCIWFLVRNSQTASCTLLWLQ